jgi:hypothetical protein
MPAKVQIACCCLFLFGPFSATSQDPRRPEAASTVPANATPQQKTNSPSPIDGVWEGVLKLPVITLRIVLHISGTDNGLTATSDSPDQGAYGKPVDSISFQGSTLQFEISRINVRFTGDLLADGTISGEFVQRGNGVALVLSRSSGAAPPASGSVENGHYHHDQTGLEFDLPPGFSVRDTANYFDNRGWQATITDSQRSNAVVASVWMAKRNRPEQRIPSIIDSQIPAKIARRTTPNHPYAIPADSIQKMTINGRQAIKAIGGYQQLDGQKMVELLTWISPNTRTFTSMPCYQLIFFRMCNGASIRWFRARWFPNSIGHAKPALAYSRDRSEL